MGCSHKAVLDGTELASELAAYRLYLILSNDRTIAQASEALGLLIGDAPENLTGKALECFVHASERPALRQAMDSAMQGESSHLSEVPLVGRHHNRVLRDIWLSPFVPGGDLSILVWGDSRRTDMLHALSDSGIVSKLIPIVAHDERERRKAERALEENEIRLKLALEIAQLGIWDWDLRTNELTWTKETKMMCALPPNTPVNFDLLLSALSPADRANVQKKVAEAMDPDGDGRYAVEYPLVGITDHVERWISVRGQVFFDERKKPYRFLGAAIDNTEKRKTETSLRELSAQLRRSNDAFRDFAFIASHDLKEPLRTLAMFSHALRDELKGKLSASSEEYVSFIIDGAERMYHLIDNLLRHARVENLGIDVTWINTTEIINDVLMRLKNSILSNGAIIEHDPLPKILADETGVFQVFLNLIGNSLKFRGKEPPRIHISAKSETNEWTIMVSDNGIGIPSERQEMIFTPFHRLHSPATYEGSGLGLSICKRIVENHGGRIWVVSSPGKGSTFFVAFPRRTAETARQSTDKEMTFP